MRILATDKSLDMIIVPDNFVDFKTVKQQVSIEAVLKHYDVNLRRIKESMKNRVRDQTKPSESGESFCVRVRETPGTPVLPGLEITFPSEISISVNSLPV